MWWCNSSAKGFSCPLSSSEDSSNGDTRLLKLEISQKLLSTNNWITLRFWWELRSHARFDSQDKKEIRFFHVARLTKKVSFTLTLTVWENYLYTTNHPIELKENHAFSVSVLKTDHQQSGLKYYWRWHDMITSFLKVF